jgi:hypothetical protein
MNIELAKKVYEHITTRRELFKMNTWIYIDPTADNPFDYKQSDCGTTACIAGWAAILSGYSPEDCECEEVASIAERELELTPKQSSSLFLDADEEKAIERLKRAINLAESGQLEDGYIWLDGEDAEDESIRLDLEAPTGLTGITGDEASCF